MFLVVSSAWIGELWVLMTIFSVCWSISQKVQQTAILYTTSGPCPYTHQCPFHDSWVWIHYCIFVPSTGSQGNKDHIVTQNGNLRCKKILHKFGTTSASGIKTFIAEALTECARLQATSVAFPAIGTGLCSDIYTAMYHIPSSSPYHYSFFFVFVPSFTPMYHCTLIIVSPHPHVNVLPPMSILFSFVFPVSYIYSMSPLCNCAFPHITISPVSHCFLSYVTMPSPMPFVSPLCHWPTHRISIIKKEAN